MSSKKTVWVWIDLEMTGLNPAEDHLLEVAVLLTHPSLEVIAQGPAYAIHQPPEVLAKMNAWCQTTHRASGLLERVQASAIDTLQAQAELCAFLEAHIAPGEGILCGNSIWQDRRFIMHHWPLLEHYLHYRMIDVSTFKECARHWHPDLFAKVQKKNTHRALDDILESIEELRVYHDAWFKS